MYFRSPFAVASLCALALIGGAFGCKPSNETSANASHAGEARAYRSAAHSSTPSFVDDYGDTVHVQAPPKRIVSLNPTTTEILFTIGASSRIVGRSHWDEWPDSAKFIADVGNAIRPNVEAILAAHPDLVILYASADNALARQRLHESGIPTLSLKIDGVDEFDRAVRAIGQITGDTTRARIVADTVRQTLNRVKAATATLSHPTVVWPFAYRPVMVVGGGSYLDELITIAGAKNIYSELTQPSPAVTIEDVVQRNPYYVLRSADVAQTGPLDPSWNAVPAVQAGRLLVTRTSLIARPSVQLGMAAVHLANILHPNLNLQ